MSAPLALWTIDPGTFTAWVLAVSLFGFALGWISGYGWRSRHEYSD